MDKKTLWQEPIDEEKLDKLAGAYKEEMKKFGWSNPDEQELIKQTFKAGYRKAWKLYSSILLELFGTTC